MSEQVILHLIDGVTEVLVCGMLIGFFWGMAKLAEKMGEEQ